MRTNLSTAAAVLACATVLAPTAANAFPTCATQAEYGQVTIGMKKATVDGIFDGYPGFISHYFTAGTTEYDRRRYDHCGSTADIVVEYRRTIGSGNAWRVGWKGIQ